MQLAKKPTKRQKEVLLRVLKYIKQEPDRLDMFHWGQFHPITGWNYDLDEADPTSAPTTFFPDYKEQPIPSCKTTACLGGTVLLVTKKGKKELKSVLKGEGKNRYYEVPFPDDTDEIAGNILNLTPKQRGDLFYFKSWDNHVDIETGKIGWNDQPVTKYVKVGWPRDFERMYKKAKTGKERYRALEARVRHFFKTGL